MGGGDFDKSEKISISDLDFKLGNNSKFPDLVQQGLELKNFQTNEIPSADESNQMIQEFWERRFPDMFYNVSNLIQNAASLGFNSVEYWYYYRDESPRGPNFLERTARQKFELRAYRYIGQTLLPSKGYQISILENLRNVAKPYVQKHSFQLINNVDFAKFNRTNELFRIQVRW